LKTAFRRIGQVLLLCIAFIAAGTFIPRPLWHSAHAGASAPRDILLLSNPIHTDIAIPLDDALRSRFTFLTEAGVPVDNPGAKYLVLGWGGRSFYLETPHWADIKPLPVLRALTLDRSVMHVLNRMLDFITASFAQDQTGPLAIAGAHYGRYDAFYEANGSFNAFAGCNTWTAHALREAGLRTGLWNPVPQTLAVSLKLYN